MASLRDDPRISKLVAALDLGAEPAQVVGAMGGFAGLMLAALRRARPRTLVIVTPDEERGEEILLSLALFERTRGAMGATGAFWPLDHQPMSGMSPSRLLVMERTATLFRLVHGLDLAAVVVPARALVDRVVPRAVLSTHGELVISGESLDRAGFLRFLDLTGYHRVVAIEDPGTYAVRGGIVDVFSPMIADPVRIELWGDRVESIRRFDATSQRTTGVHEEITLGPVRDVIFEEATVTRARDAILDLADSLHVPTGRARAVVDDVERGVLGVGMEDLLPAFYDRLDTLFDLVPGDAIWVVDSPDACREAIDAQWKSAKERAARVRSGGGQLAFGAEALFVPAMETVARLEKVTAIEMVPFATVEDRRAVSVRFDVDDNRDVRADILAASRDGGEDVLAPLTDRVRRWREAGLAVVACAHTPSGADRLQGLLGHYGLRVVRQKEPFALERVPELRDDPAELHLFVGDPGHGFRSEPLGLVLLDETEILGRRVRRSRRRHARVAPEAALASWRDLREGDHVVHLQHGIGRYLGLTKTSVDGIEVDFLELAYARSHKLFVPVDKLHLVSKHTPGEGAAPRLDTLGGTGWVKVRRRVKRAIRDIADKLLALQAERAGKRGHAFTAPGGDFARFEAAFPWQETPDQERTIEEVLRDMQRERPMDRLVCGDVGFGKTEVAMRAAMLAVLDGKQVAVLVPTLVLAEQHRITFERRMEDHGVHLATLTRATSQARVREVRRGLERGSVDIVIGTHKLLGKGISFRDLGLIVVDEEHRFGVAHKETLKALRAEVDILTLTATPIPRTLHMAMSGLRDISLIQTPPVDRLSIRTLVAQPSEEVIRESISAELARGGQVFVVHNRVQDIDEKAGLVQRLVPQARVVVGHGQMAPGKLDKVMMKFLEGQANVLVSTTIIESGLDIPSANTILIDRADRFGLVQLYQLRGRVGRSTTRATCYLLIPSPRNLEGDAAQRIAALQRFTELGSGFSIAGHDLDIRGAGDLLGADQAGHIQAVGYDAYMHMLREAIRELESEEADVPAPVDPELKIAMEARLPESWLPETTLRLRVYRQWSGAETVEALYEAYEEAVDRFGKPPEAAQRLVELMAIKLSARRLGMVSVGYRPGQLSYGLGEHGVLSGPVLTGMLNRPGNRYRITPEMQLVRAVTTAEWEGGLATLRESLREIANFASKTPPP